ncbi:MAG TPA: glutamate-5-semialdehyde dehydrogenase [Moorella mulderi]|nr:glutamate-5-semialdehyde dehydrogenase [Moorella mulderi]
MAQQEIEEKGRKAKEAARKLAALSSEHKNQALLAMAEALEKGAEDIMAANMKDMDLAREQDLPPALLDRLLLNERRIKAMVEGLRELVKLPDPIGQITSMWRRPNGLWIGRMRVPLGVIGMIYESRPNVTVDAAGLCLKTGNAVLLRGGSEAFNSNKALVSLISRAAVEAGIPEGAIQMVESPGREAVGFLLRAREYLDVLIPRGGAGLIQAVVENATVPVIETGVGNCHIYVDREADLTMALNIVINAKTQRPGVCNAVETLLVHREIAPAFLPALAAALGEKGVVLRGCPETLKFIPGAEPAAEEDWTTEYLDLILAVRVVEGLDQAVEHIHRYGTGHSEAIVTQNISCAQEFLSRVDAACVYVNASTRFTDGYEFGFGAEIGISTQKLHARGPMGLEQLTTYKYVIIGSGQIRQ